MVSEPGLAGGLFDSQRVRMGTHVKEGVKGMIFILNLNVAFDILHIVGNSSVTLLRTDKVLGMGHDPSMQRKSISLFRGSPCSMGRGRGRDKLHKGTKYGPKSCIEKQLVLSEPESIVRIRGGGGGIG